jgi:hypothetical protein
MMEKPPQILQAFGYTHPMNVAKNQSLLGMTGYYTPGLADRDKALDTIGQLVKAKVIQKPMPDGSIDFQPTIPADGFEDDHQLCVDVCKAWCQSASGRRAREMNPDGYANVRAWGTAHMKLLNPPPPPPPPPPAPRLNINAKLTDMIPQQQQTILSDFNLAAAPVPPPPAAQAGPVPAPAAPPPGGPFKAAGPAAPALPLPGGGAQPLPSPLQ